MYRCQECGNLSEPGAVMHRKVVETVNVIHPERRSEDGKTIIDKGGRGTQIKKEIEGKNPNRVLPQIKRKLKNGKIALVLNIISFIFAAFIGIGGFFFDWISPWFQYPFLFLATCEPFNIWGIIDNNKYLICKIDYLETIIKENKNL